MEISKDRLPRDLYINEPDLKFNTAGRSESATRIRYLRNALLRGDYAIQPGRENHFRAVTFPSMG